MLRLVLLRLLESYFRHRWLYLLPIVIMIGLSVVFIKFKKPLYISEGILYVQKGSLLNSLTSIRNDSFSWLTPAQETAEEINDLIKTDAFMRAVISKTDLEAEMDGGLAQTAEVIQTTRQSIWVTPNGSNQLLIGAAREDRELPAQLVNAVVDNFVQWKINEDLTESTVAQEFFQNLTVDYEADLIQARQELDEYFLNHPAPERGERPEIEQIQIVRLEGDVRLAEQRYSNAIANDEVARLAMTKAESTAPQSYFLIDAPKVPLTPAISLTDLIVNVVIFIIVGVIFSGVGIVGSALLDRTLRVPLDIEHNLNLPVLGALPDISSVLATYETQPAPDSSSAVAADKVKTTSQTTLAEPQPTQ